jgi:hypothetical protein
VKEEFIAQSASNHRREFLHLLWTMAQQPETRISYGNLFETAMHGQLRMGGMYKLRSLQVGSDIYLKMKATVKVCNLENLRKV